MMILHWPVRWIVGFEVDNTSMLAALVIVALFVAVFCNERPKSVQNI